MVLTNWHHVVQRTCKACGAAWLTTGRQARFRPARPFGSTRSNNSDLASQFTCDDEIEVLDKLKSCPKCGLQKFTQRAVTKKDPASAGADRSGLE